MLREPLARSVERSLVGEQWLRLTVLAQDGCFWKGEPVPDALGAR